MVYTKEQFKEAINQEDINGNNVIHRAVDNDDPDLIALAIDYDKTLLKARNKKGQTPIKLAIEKKAWVCLEMIIRSMPKLNFPTLKSIFNAAVKEGKKRIVGLLLDKVDDADREEFNKLCFKKLYDSIGGNETKWLDILANPAIINQQDPLTGNTLLHAAVLRDSHAIPFLLARNADQSIENFNHLIPFELASSSRRVNRMRELILDPNFKTHYQKKPRTAFPLLFKNSQPSSDVLLLSRDMLEAGLNPNEQDSAGNTLFHYLMQSVQYSSKELVERLLEKADFSIANAKGKTALQLGVNYKSDDGYSTTNFAFDWAFSILAKRPERFDLSPVLEEAILALRVNTARTILNHDSTSCWKYGGGGNYFVDLVVERSYLAYLDMLMKNGANPNIRDQAGLTIFDRQAAKNNSSLIYYELFQYKEKRFYYWNAETLEDKHAKVLASIKKVKDNYFNVNNWPSVFQDIINQYMSILQGLSKLFRERIVLLNGNQKNQQVVIGEYVILSDLADKILAGMSFDNLQEDYKKSRATSLPETKYILDFMEFLELSAGFKKRLETFLKAFRNELTTTPWQIWRAGWVDGKPLTIQILTRETDILAGSNETLSINQLLSKLRRISSTLRARPTANKERHPYSEVFYIRFGNEIFNFLFTPTNTAAQEVEKKVTVEDVSTSTEVTTISTVEAKPIMLSQPVLQSQIPSIYPVLPTRSSPAKIKAGLAVAKPEQSAELQQRIELFDALMTMEFSGEESLPVAVPIQQEKNISVPRSDLITFVEPDASLDSAAAQPIVNVDQPLLLDLNFQEERKFTVPKDFEKKFDQEQLEQSEIDKRFLDELERNREQRKQNKEALEKLAFLPKPPMEEPVVSQPKKRREKVMGV